MIKVQSVVEEGIAAGELIPAEQTQIIYAGLGANVFYFLSAPMMRLARNVDLLEPAAISFRRKAAIEYLGQAIFIDREHGSRIAAKVLATTPMPQPKEFETIKIENRENKAATIPAVDVRQQ